MQCHTELEHHRIGEEIPLHVRFNMNERMCREIYIRKENSYVRLDPSMIGFAKQNARKSIINDHQRTKHEKETKY